MPSQRVRARVRDRVRCPRNVRVRVRVRDIAAGTDGLGGGVETVGSPVRVRAKG